MWLTTLCRSLKKMNNNKDLEPSLCDYCGDAPSVKVNYYGGDHHHRWICICGCYDGAPDSDNRHHFGHGKGPLSAIDEWNNINNSL